MTTRKRALFFTASLLFCATTTVVAMIANPNPNPIEEIQPDGTRIQLFLKGHPFSGAFMTDAEGHPVVRDEQGWYVYGAHQHDNQQHHIGGRTRLLTSQRRVGEADPEASTPPDLSTLWHDNDHIVKSSPNFEENGEGAVLTPMLDLLCEGMERTPWCPHNPVSVENLGRSDVKTSDVGGTMNMIVILVRFADHLDRELLPKEHYEALFNSDVDDPNINPTGSVKKYYNIVSNGNFNLQATVVDWITIPQTEEEMSFGKNGLSSRFAQTATLSLQYMDQQLASDGRSWSEYDRNNDGEIDAIFIVTSGYAAEMGGTDCINNKDYGTHRIWSHRAIAPNEPEYFHSADAAVRIGSYATTSGFHGSCDQRSVRIGVLCHEIGHILGLPDMLSAAGFGVGSYDIMAQMWGVSGSQLNPPLMGAYSRQLAGWVKPTTITSDGMYEIGSSANHGDVFRIDAGFPPGEYFLQLAS
jgi:M6 family metalloprotease-like protein